MRGRFAEKFPVIAPSSVTACGRATSCPRCGIRFPGPVGHGNRAAAWLCPRFIRRRRRFGHSPPRGRRGDKIKLFTAFPLGGRLFFIRPPGGHRFFLYSLFTGKKAPLSGCFSCYKTDQYASFSRRYSFSWLMGIRTCSMVSRSRTVTQLSPAFSPSPTVSKSTVMQ